MAVNYGNAAVTGGHYSLSRYDFAHEVNAISTSPAMACYVTNLWGITFTTGAGSNTLDQNTVTAWANLRLEGLAEETYAERRYGLTYSSDVLSAAATNLTAQMTAAANANGASCPQSATLAFANMPTAVAASLLRAEAASEFLSTKLPARISESTTSLQAFYQAHLTEYQKICVAIALVAPTDLSAFNADRTAGMSVGSLAAKYSKDASASQGGAYGCFGPSSTARDLTRDVALNTYGNPQVINQQGTNYWLYVAPISRTQLSYADVATQVIDDIRSVNSGSVDAVKQSIFQEVGIDVNPLIGRYGSGQQGVGIYPPASPASTITPNGGTGLDASTALHF